VLIEVLMSPVPVSPATATETDARFQVNALLNPSKELLLAESRGPITIYDGLDNAIVERALDEPSGRIENMMFIRTRHPGVEGEVTAEDDNCQVRRSPRLTRGLPLSTPTYPVPLRRSGPALPVHGPAGL
jgi:hypothetical protein